MSPEELELFHKSLNRCAAQDDFLETFYDLFKSSSPEVREKFVGVNWFRQKRAMVASLHMMVVAEEKGTDGNPHLEQVAAAHSKESRDIPPHLYDEWLRCLLLAAAKFDPHWDEQSEAIWRKMMEKGIRYMTARYEGPSA